MFFKKTYVEFKYINPTYAEIYKFGSGMGNFEIYIVNSKYHLKNTLYVHT